jgi:hypothetical protein
MAVAHGVPDAQAALRVCQRLAQAPARRVPELCRAARRVRFRLDVLPRPEPFTAETAPGALEDLRTRLRGMRWPDTPRGRRVVARDRPRLPP